MDAHYSASGFVLRKFALPCCDHVATLHELNYEWPQGFARCAISIRNPSIGQLSGDQIAQLEAISGARVRVIYRHL